MAYYPRVPGERCYLSPIDPNDAPKYVEWLNDPELAVMLQIVVKPVSVAGEREWIEKFAKDPYQFAIVDAKSNKLIGGCGL
ncbi:MAG: GNAT family N-acetyltransferase, partial [Spirochaetia bacterium]